MNIKISVVVFMLISFLIMGAIPNNISSAKDSFGILEANVANISEFEENGVKLQYKTKDNIEKESVRIKECLINNINGSYRENNKNQFEIFNNDFHADIKIWCEDKYNYIEITLINKNAQYTTVDLKNILKILENKKSKSIKYFFYYEGKELDNHYSIDELANKNNIQKVDLLEINNGYTGTGYLNDGDKINFALTKYNTGSHIIIGAPIIFATY